MYVVLVFKFQGREHTPKPTTTTKTTQPAAGRRLLTVLQPPVWGVAGRR